MADVPERLRIIKLHWSWANGLTLLSQLVAFLLFGAVFLLYEREGMSVDERNGAFVFLGVMVLIAVVWQAIGLGIARLHMIVKGLDLEHRN